MFLQRPQAHQTSRMNTPRDGTIMNKEANNQVTSVDQMSKQRQENLCRAILKTIRILFVPFTDPLFEPLAEFFNNASRPRFQRFIAALERTSAKVFGPAHVFRYSDNLTSIELVLGEVMRCAVASLAAHEGVFPGLQTPSLPLDAPETDANAWLVPIAESVLPSAHWTALLQATGASAPSAASREAIFRATVQRLDNAKNKSWIFVQNDTGSALAWALRRPGSFASLLVEDFEQVAATEPKSKKSNIARYKLPARRSSGSGSGTATPSMSFRDLTVLVAGAAAAPAQGAGAKRKTPDSGLTDREPEQRISAPLQAMPRISMDVEPTETPLGLGAGEDVLLMPLMLEQDRELQEFLHHSTLLADPHLFEADFPPLDLHKTSLVFPGPAPAMGDLDVAGWNQGFVGGANPATAPSTERLFDDSCLGFN